MKSSSQIDVGGYAEIILDTMELEAFQLNLPSLIVENYSGRNSAIYTWDSQKMVRKLVPAEKLKKVLSR